jgi:glyoxylate utilization-related uncharacterized protein
MKMFLGLCCTILLALAAQAQPAKPAPGDYQLIPLAEQKLVTDKSGLYSTVILAQHRNAVALVTARDKSGQAESHAAWADYIFIQDGAATMVLGGTMQNPKQASAGEMRGSGISGGKTIALHAGDYLYIPVNMAHQMMLSPGKSIRYAVVKTHP